MNKRPDITEETRRKFTDKFCELYMKKPMDRITVKEIAESLHYNRSTFYEYFTDIYDLRDQLEDELADYILETIRNAVNNDLLGADFASVFRNLLSTEEHYARALLFNQHDAHFVERAVDKACIPMQLVFGKGQGSRRAEYAIRYHIAGIMHLARHLDRDKYSDDELAQAVQMILQKGVLAAITE